MRNFKHSIFTDTAISAVILVVAFLCSLGMQNLLNANSLIPSVFVLAIFLIALTTQGYFYGLVAAPICVLAVNFAFTFPYFAFDFTIPENIVSAIIMISVTVATSTLTTIIKKQEIARIEADKEKMRADLLRAISHDLRTPLTAIYGSSSTVTESYNSLSDEKKLEILRGITKDSQWLIRMVENLLSITKVDNSSVKLIKSEVVLEELIDTVLTKFKKHYPNQAVKLSLPEEFIIISADAILIEQVLVNLLENAVEHAVGMDELRLDIYEKDAKIVFEVTDNGCGIEKDKLKSIFLGYYSSEDLPTDNKKHCMGIGLSVCAAIIKAHGGKIEAENARKGGMTFRFSLDAVEVLDE